MPWKSQINSCWFPNALLANPIFTGLYDSRPGDPTDACQRRLGSERSAFGVRLAADQWLNCALVIIGIRRQRVSAKRRMTRHLDDWSFRIRVRPVHAETRSFKRRDGEGPHASPPV